MGGPVPVWVGEGQHELELHQAGAIRELPVLQAVQLVGDVPTSHVHLRGAGGTTVPLLPPTHPHHPESLQAHHSSPSPHLQRCHAHHLVGVVEEDGEHIEDGGF